MPSAGSITATSTFVETYTEPPRGNDGPLKSEDIVFATPQGDLDRTLVTGQGAGLVDFGVIPHLEHVHHPDASLSNAERWAARIPAPTYAIDDQTAIKVTDGTVEVISEGWQFATMQHAAQAHGWTRFVSMQDQYSLIHREEEREMFGLLAAPSHFKPHRHAVRRLPSDQSEPKRAPPPSQTLTVMRVVNVRVPPRTLKRLVLTEVTPPSCHLFFLCA